MIRPTLQRLSHFSGVASPIINSSNASLVATDMIEDSLDDVPVEPPTPPFQLRKCDGDRGDAKVQCASADLV